MSMLLLVLALAAPVSPDPADSRSGDGISCSVDVRALDARGTRRSAQRVSAAVAPAVVFRGRVTPPDAEAPTLLFDVFNPRGQRYQVLVATPRFLTPEPDGERHGRTARTREAALAVAGSAIAWTSMFGKWRVEPRLDGSLEPCGKAEYFTIRP